MQAPGHQLLPPVPQTAGEQLAGELFENPRIIRSLVIAQKVRADLKSVRLLREALERLWHDVTGRDTRLIVCEGIAELSMLLGDGDRARRWAERGLQIDAYYAPLALVLAQLPDEDDSADAAAAPDWSAPDVRITAREVLHRTLEVHPDYRDVRAALIRRQHADGEADAARRQLHQWTEQEPDHPIVTQLRQELAA